MLFISEWDERCDWLQTTSEHDVVWSIWAGDHAELSCAHLNREWKFHAKSHELIGAFLACPPEHKVLHCYVTNAVRCLVTRQLYPSCGFYWADCWCFQVSNHFQEIHSASFAHHTVLTDKHFKSASHLPVKFSWFCLILYIYLGLDNFAKVK